MKSNNLNLSRPSYSLRNFKFKVELLEVDENDYELLNNSLKDQTGKMETLGTEANRGL